MTPKREKERPKQVTKLSEVFKDVSEPIYYRLSVLEDKGERWRIVNWGDYPRLVVSTYSPRGFVNVLNVRLSIEGIEKAKKRLQKVLKLLETLEKLDAEKKITLKQEFKYEEKPVNIEDALREQLNDGE
jgi:hypothetical protein